MPVTELEYLVLPIAVDHPVFLENCVMAVLNRKFSKPGLKKENLFLMKAQRMKMYYGFILRDLRLFVVKDLNRGLCGRFWFVYCG